jgi:hypothetical protein
MRSGCIIALAVALGAVAVTVDDTPANASCSVFSRRPCMQTGCSVYQRRPCMPDYEFWIGQDLRLTVESNATDGQAVPAADTAGHELNSIREMFAALRHCWQPPPLGDTPAGMQMSVRFAFKRSGEIMATPRITYTTPGTSPEFRARYLNAITTSLERCTPMQFSAGLAGAIAGRPIAIRFVDNRIVEEQKEQP